MIEKCALLFERINNNPNLPVLALFFNCAMLMDFHDIYTTNPYYLVLLFSCVFFNFINFKFWYTSIITFLFTFSYYLYYFPRQANHANVALFFELFIAIILLKFIFFSTEFSFKKYRLTIKIAFICVYFYTGFHKLNYDFFNTDTSCTNFIFQNTFQYFFGSSIVVPKIVTIFFQVVTLFIEIILPFGLLFKKTEKYVVFVCVIFHGFLSLSYFSDFSSLAGFLLLVCTLNSVSISKSLGLFIRIYVGCVLVAIVYEVLVMRYHVVNSRYIFVASLLFATGWFSFFFYYLKNYSTPIESSIISYKSIVLCVVFLSIWSLKGYFGFGNLANLTMFSNLTTESSRSNHLIINTKYTKIANFEEDTLKIVSVCDDLKYEEIEGFLLPMVEFKYKVKEWTNHYDGKELGATIVYKNDTIVIKDLKKSIYNQQKWYYKYIPFRKIQPQKPAECYW